MRRIGIVVTALSMATACGSAAPTAPGTSSPAALTVTCDAATILAGALVVCRASRASTYLGPEVTWTSSNPDVATHEGIGLFVGRREGQATLTASAEGQSASAVLTVHLEDALRVTATAHQGTFAAGSTVTLWLQGFYGVASADSGRLDIVVSDQKGFAIAASGLTVPQGGDRYILSTTFTLGPGTTRVCRAAVLRIGATTLTAVPSTSLAPCFDVTP
jgi:hypothetical protein